MLEGSGAYMLAPRENFENMVHFRAFWTFVYILIRFYLEKFPKNSPKNNIFIYENTYYIYSYTVAIWVISFR